MHSSVGRTQLDGVMVFLMVAELRGFRAAAGRLGITPSAVSYAVRALETRVGAPLFSRTTRSVALTEAGERLLAHARPAVEMLTEGIDAASGLGGETRGRLRINAPRAVIPLLVERLVPEFHELHPKVQLELVGEDRLIDIVAEGFDAGIRFGHLVQADMVATSLTPPDRYVVVGSPPFLRKHGRPKIPADVRRFPCIGYQRAAGVIEPWRFIVARKPLAIGVDAVLATNDVEACIRAVLRGAGLFCVARSLVSPYLRSRAVETVLDAHALELPALSIYYPSRSQSLPKLRAFIELAKARMRPPPGTPRRPSTGAP